jgi:hypothetical protein
MKYKKKKKEIRKSVPQTVIYPWKGTFFYRRRCKSNIVYIKIMKLARLSEFHISVH